MAEVLTSWKEIAQFLGKGVRTVQRWEAFFGLPVRRAKAGSHAAVIAIPEELDAWVRSRELGREDETQLRAEMKRLREEVNALRKENDALRRKLQSVKMKAGSPAQRGVPVVTPRTVRYAQGRKRDADGRSLP